MIHFIAGMPRSGSTLLCNILAQNPRFQATATSGIIDALFTCRNSWEAIHEFRGLNNSAVKLDVMRGMLNGYYGIETRPVIFDKGRSWLAYIEMAEALLERKVKILVSVRDVREILSSFEKLWRKSRHMGPMAQEKAFYIEYQTVEGRCNVLMREEQVVGVAYTRIRDAILRGLAERMHFVPFEKLTKDPSATMAGIYRFLGETAFKHDFDHVEQVTREDDSFYNLAGLHDIRAKVEPVPLQAAEVLGEAADKYTGPFVWSDYL